METAEGFASLGVADTARGRRSFVERLEERAREEGPRKCGGRPPEGQNLQSTFSRGWYWGSQAFHERMLALLPKSKGGKVATNRNYRASLQGRDRRDALALKILQSGMSALGLDAKSLADTPGSDLRKVALATVLHRETTIPQRWIADHLHMRSPANVSQQIRRFATIPTRDLPTVVQLWLRSVTIC